MDDANLRKLQGSLPGSGRGGIRSIT